MAINIQSLDSARLEQAFELSTQVFIEASSLHKALGIGLAQYQCYLRKPFENMVAEGLSLAAIDSDSDALLGCLIVTDFASQSATMAECPDDIAPIVALTSELAQQYATKRQLSPSEAILVDMGAVSSIARGTGVYKQMRRAINSVAKQKGFRWVLGELSSSATQHVVIKQMKHRIMAEVGFQSFVFNGELPFKTIKEPPSIILTEGEL